MITRTICGVLILFVAVLTSLIVSAAEPAASDGKAAFVRNLDAGKPQKIVFFGTSLTQYGAYVGQVQKALTAAYPNLVTFHNGAKAGEQSRWGLANVQANVVDQRPDVVFIEFTINDAVERFKMPVEESKANHEQIIDKILAANPDCQIILQTTNPVVGKEGTPSHRKDLPAYEQMYRDLAKSRGLLLIDHAPTWKAVLDKGETEFKKWVPDGVHPNGPGWATYVTPTILKTIGVPAVVEKK